MHYSVGAFEGDQLVGFILHGYDVINGVPTIYNAGTGVIGSHRGRGITKALYEFAIPLLAEQGIYTQVLEVIENNFPAMRVYEMIGFCTKRKLQAFKGKPGIQLQRNYSISHPDAAPDEVAFSDTVSAWQNSLASVDRDRSGHQLIGVFENDRLIGFAAYVAATGRIKQLAVRPDVEEEMLVLPCYHSSGRRAKLIN